MNISWMDFIGTIAFAFSGSMVAIRKKMDVFGVLVLGLFTATGGGCLRDIFLGNTPPVIFKTPIIFVLSLSTSLILFITLYRHKTLPKKGMPVYQNALFVSDTLGLASFTIAAMQIGVSLGYADNWWLMLFTGTITATGGGIIRDVCAQKMPDIFVKQVYASAVIAGVLTFLTLYHSPLVAFADVAAFGVIVAIRLLAAKFCWDLPRVEDEKTE